MNNLMVVTDLDGSLLDHYTYSYAAALPTLKTLLAQRVPVVLCSSKTRAEMQVLRAKLGLEGCPYIVENGAAIFCPVAHYPDIPGTAKRLESDGGYPEEWCHAFGKDRLHWQDLLMSLPDDLRTGYRKFSKMSVGQIADLTGLSMEDAALAAKREFGEPLQWRGDEDQKLRLIEALESRGARVLQGGRFLHVAGDWDKGRALNWLADYLEHSRGTRPVTIALGDSHNDIAMLDAADYAVVIRSPVHPPPTLSSNSSPKKSRKKQVLITKHTGPRGWAEGIEQILAGIQL